MYISKTYFTTLNLPAYASDSDVGVKSYADPSGNLCEAWNDHLGIYVYRLPAEKILHIVEKVNRRGELAFSRADLKLIQAVHN